MISTTAAVPAPRAGPDPDDILGPFWTLPVHDSGPAEGWACAGCLTVGERAHIAVLGDWARDWLALRDGRTLRFR
jgi:hypothetical protein